MNAKKCDRCGEFYTIREPNVFETIMIDLRRNVDFLLGKQQLRELVAIVEKTIDLCPCCTKDLYRFFGMEAEYVCEKDLKGSD